MGVRMRYKLVASVLLALLAVQSAFGWEMGFRDSGSSRAAAAFPVDAMLVGDKVLQVTDSRQLTLRSEGKVVEVHVSPNGRYVVYLIADNRGKADLYDCRLVKVSTGKSATIMSRVPLDQLRTSSNEVWTLDGSPGIAWSPDSSSFALKATRVIWATGKETRQQFIVVYSASGAFKKALPIDSPRENEGATAISQKLHFTPDSRRIVANLLIPKSKPGKIWELYPTVRTFDLSSGSSRDITLPKLDAENLGGQFVWARPPSLVGFSSDGALLLTDWGQGNGTMHKVTLDGKSDEVLMSDCMAEEWWSSDGQFSICPAGGLVLRSPGSKPAVLVADQDATLGAWTPNNRLFLYTKSEHMSDSEKKRTRDFRSLWLSDINVSKRGSLCVALDAEQLPSSSQDCRAIAYISQGQLYVAELALREPTLREKLESGLLLSEDEMTVALLTNGKQIAFAIIMYCADNDGRMPQADSVVNAIHDYLPKDDVFRVPGTQVNAFRYVNPGVANQNDILRPAETIIGEMDAGYGWKVAIYADGHTALVEKQ